MPRPEGKPAMESADTKQCPYCAETIKAAAVKCRYCHSDLTGTAPSSPAPLPAASPPSEGPAGGPAAGPAEPAAAPKVSLAQVPPPDAEASARPAAPRRARARARLSTPVVAAAVVAVVLALGFAVLAVRDWRAANRLADAAAAGKTVRAQVADNLETLLSYKYTTFDQDLAAAKKVMTTSFEKQYAPTVDAIRQRALDQKRSQKANVSAVAVLSQTPDRVDMLVFVDTVSTTKGSKRTSVLQNRVKVTFENTGGTWLIDDLAVPQS